MKINRHSATKMAAPIVTKMALPAGAMELAEWAGGLSAYKILTLKAAPKKERAVVQEEGHWVPVLVLPVTGWQV